jgi:hypothetical protein
MHPASAILAAVAFSFSCAQGARDSEPPPPHPQRDPDPTSSLESSPRPSGASPGGELSCGERMDRLGARLIALNEQGATDSAVPPAITPIESSAGTPLQGAGTQLLVGADGDITLLGARLGGIEELRERLDLELAMMRHDGRIGPLHIWADRAVPLARVAAVAAAAPEGLEVRLAFAGPERPRSAYEDELLAVPRVARSLEELEGAADYSQKALLAAAMMEATIGLCAPLVKVYGDVAGVAAEKRNQFIAAQAPEAIRECGCEVADLERLEFLLLWNYGAFDRPARSVPPAEADHVFE